MKQVLTIVAVVGVAGMTAAAFADGRVTLNYATNSNYLGGSGGGGFQATAASGFIGLMGGNGGTSNSFVTFCVEEGEEFSPGSTYYAHISDSAKSGQATPGSGWDPVTNTFAAIGSDPISPTTALLYQTFRDGGNFGGTITGAADTVSEVAAVQQAIWFSEGEIYSQDESGFDTAYSLASHLFNWAKGEHETSIGNVRVLQMWQNADFTGNSQDQLTIVPLPPAAFAGMGTLAGVLGLGYLRRRKLSAM